jgi:cobyrinic acid a,c-diamide synthase
LGDEVVEAIHRQVDTAGLEAIARHRSFFPGGSVATVAGHHVSDPLVMVAGGPGFTTWSRDSIELLRAAGARVKRLDLVEDEGLPTDAAGVVLAGHIWTEALPDLAYNYQLMREIRVLAGEGLPLLALGGGMLYLLRRLQDERGRSFDMAGLLPAEGEIVEELPEPAYLDVEAARDNVLFDQGEWAKGWMSTDAEIMESAGSRGYAFSVSAQGWPEPLGEGLAASNLLASRVLLHLGSTSSSARRFVEACARYSAGRPTVDG